MTKDVKNFPGYTVDKFGRVFNVTKGFYVKHGVHSKGYVTVCLRRGGKSYICLLHRVLAEAWLPNPHQFSQVNHKNGVKDDFSLGNLEWVTPQENILHAFRVLKKKNGRQKITEHASICFYSLHAAGVKKVRIAELFKISPARVGQIIKRSVLCKQ